MSVHLYIDQSGMVGVCLTEYLRDCVGRVNVFIQVLIVLYAF